MDMISESPAPAFINSGCSTREFLNQTHVGRVYDVILASIAGGVPVPGVDAMAQLLGLTQHKIRTSIAWCVKAGWIELDWRPGDRGRRYRIVATGECSVVPVPEPKQAMEGTAPGRPPAPAPRRRSPAEIGSARLLKAIARYHHARGRAGWEALL